MRAIGLLFLSAQLVSIAVAQRGVSQSALRVEGSITLHVYRGSNSQFERSNTFAFSCVKAPNEWNIGNRFLENAEEFFSFDGTNVYKALTFTALHRESDKRPALATERSLEELNAEKHLVIIPGEHPLGNAGVNITWLAFCSEQYLKKSGRSIPLPICEIRNTHGAFAYEDKTSVFDHGNGLPEKVTLFESTELLAKNRNDERLTIASGAVERVPRFVNGRVAFTYNVLKTTNFLGRTLPVEFNFVQYAYSSSDALQRKIVGSGSVSSISEGNIQAGPFVGASHYRVNDLRFRSRDRVVDAIQYKWAEAAAPSTNDPRLLSIFHEKENIRPRR
jgi:hypothetical protein